MVEGRTLYSVCAPESEVVLYRLMEDESPRSFCPNHTLEKKRFSTEDAAMYRGVSMLDSRDRAKSYVKQYDRERERGGPPRWSFIGEVVLTATNGEVFASTRGPGHYTVWGEPDDLFSGLREVFPIDPEQE